MTNDKLETTLARIDERVAAIYARIEAIPRDCAKHQQQIEDLTKDVDSLWERWWWALSVGVGALITALLSLAKSAIGKQ